MNKVKKFLAIIENLIFMIFCMIVILFLVQLFCFTSFKIPSDSMGPALKDGDRIIKNISELSDSEAQAIHIEGE